MNQYIVIILLGSLGTLCNASPIMGGKSIAATFQDFHNKHEEVMRQPMEAEQRAAFFSPLYRELFSEAARPLNLIAHDRASLKLLLRAAATTATYTQSTESATDIASIVLELERRNLATQKDVMLAFEALFAARMLQESKAWANAFVKHDLPRPVSSEVHSKQGPTEWKVLPGSEELIRQDATVPARNYVLIVGHPGCHFSNNAYAALSSDETVATALQGRVKWLVPQERNYNIGLVRDWNLKHPDAKMTIAYKRSEWPIVDTWGTPAFYFIRDGRVVHKVVGWPKEGRIAEIRAGLAEIGIQPIR